jgi:hypothetical protein
VRSYWEYVGNLLRTCEKHVGNNKNPIPSPSPPPALLKKIILSLFVGAFCITSLAFFPKTPILEGYQLYITFLTWNKLGGENSVENIKQALRNLSSYLKLKFSLQWILIINLFAS